MLHAGVAGDGGALEAGGLMPAGGLDTLADGGGGFAGLTGAEFVDGEGGDFDVEVDAGRGAAR